MRLALKVIDALPERTASKVPGLGSQAIRAAMSVHANLVEGCARATRQDFLHFLEISIVSLNELEAHMLVARDARVVVVEVHRPIERDLNLVRRMPLSFLNTLQRRIAEEHAARLKGASAA